jgi:hypothetical protein
MGRFNGAALVGGLTHLRRSGECIRWPPHSLLSMSSASEINIRKRCVRLVITDILGAAKVAKSVWRWRS